MDTDRVLAILDELALLKMFPSQDAPRLALAKLVCSMASTEDQVQWLVDRTIALCNEFPGPKVLRQIFCSRFRPADRIECGPTELFPEGVPSMYPAPDLPALPSGAVASAVPELDHAISRLARAKSLDRVKRIAAPAATNPDYKPVTQADIDRAVQELRDKRGRDEAGL